MRRNEIRVQSCLGWFDGWAGFKIYDTKVYFKVVSACPYLVIVSVVVNSLNRNVIMHVMFFSCRSRRFVVHWRQRIVPVLVH